jgi:hypothetical protein
VNPQDKSTNILINVPINVKFKERIRISSIKTSTFVLRDSNDNEVTETINSDGIIATFKTTNNLSYKNWYNIKLKYNN